MWNLKPNGGRGTVDRFRTAFGDLRAAVWKDKGEERYVGES